MQLGPFGHDIRAFEPCVGHVAGFAIAFQIGRTVVGSRSPQFHRECNTFGKTQALQKPNGGVRGIVVGDTLRRLVARTIAQQLSVVVEAATAPFQYALLTRAGTEPTTTVMSIDGIGALDFFPSKSCCRC